MLDKPHMPTPLRDFHLDVMSQYLTTVRKTASRKERVICCIHYQSWHPDITQPKQSRTPGPIVGRVLESMQWCRVTIIEFVKTPDIFKTANVYQVREFFSFFPHFDL